MVPSQPKRKRGGPKAESRTSLKPTLTYVLSLYPVRDQFCRIVPISDLISLTRTCRQLSSLYRSILPTRWNIDKRLKDFVQDPKGLRSQMAIHNALISGSFAVQFIEGVKWTESDLDIFVQSGSSATKIEEYLLNVEGYHVSNLRNRDDEGYFAMSRIVVVVTLTKKRHGSTESQIQIISTTNQPIISILSGFYMTLVVNVISWNNAYALFPQPSFIYHKSYLLKEMSDYVGKLLAKYDARGWKCHDILWPEHEVYNRSMIVDRRIGDQYTWIIPLDTSGVFCPDMPDMVLEYSTFRLKKRPKDSPGLGHYEISVMDFKSMVLKHNYATLEDSSAFWMSFAGPRLESLSFLGLCKIPPSRRPRAIQNAMDNVQEGRGAYFYGHGYHLGRLQLPCYDSEIPEWYAEWESQQKAISR